MFTRTVIARRNSKIVHMSLKAPFVAYGSLKWKDLNDALIIQDVSRDVSRIIMLFIILVTL